MNATSKLRIIAEKIVIGKIFILVIYNNMKINQSI